jgi:hypothetical protein
LVRVTERGEYPVIDVLARSKGAPMQERKNVTISRSSGSHGDSEVSGQVPDTWPGPSHPLGELLTPIEAAVYLRLDETGAHSPKAAVRTLNYWRDKGELRATKFARRIWYRRAELDRFLEKKTEG